MLDIQLSTLIFQIANFLILLAVLARFLYQPLRRAMRERQEAIAEQVHQAETRAQQADADRAQIAVQKRELDAIADRILAEARARATTTGKQIVTQAREEADRLLAEARRASQRQEAEALTGLQRQIRDTAVDLAGEVIARAAGRTVHRALLADLCDTRLAPGGDAFAAVHAAAAQAHDPVEVVVAYPPSPEEQATLRTSLAGALGRPAADDGIAFRTEPDLIAGARILAGFAVVDGSLRRALDDLRREPAAAVAGEAGR